MKGKDFRSNSNLFYSRIENEKPVQASEESSINNKPETSIQSQHNNLPSSVFASTAPGSSSSSNNFTEAPQNSYLSSNKNGFNQNKSQYPNHQSRPNQNASFKSIMIHPCQKGNPLISHLRNCTWAWSDISGIDETTVPDYQLGAGNAALFLSIKYHKLHPDYVYRRLNGLKASSYEKTAGGSLTAKSGYKLLILLVWVDVPDHHESLKELHRISITSSITLFLCWNPEEAAKYLEAFKKLENQSPELIMERGTAVGEDGAYIANLTDALTKLRSVNKTDVMTLAANFPNFKSLAQATPEQLSLCPGLGDKKVIRLSKAFTQPFYVQKET
ncbi:ssDNA endonuclease and repair protein rad10 [Entomophthora muscae]|uniref:SsDNA endonuclease and repair protein rad10 n=1 Tax=Entomophthora muscae TaxID=34485 RepID=A0ACC2U005_9FUNG|nr:ssDNA endonuclease and repair protein rad10 [Entomophthora muscae]